MPGQPIVEVTFKTSFQTIHFKLVKYLFCLAISIVFYGMISLKQRKKWFDLQFYWYVRAESFIILNIILDIYLGEESMNWWFFKVGGVPTQRIQMWTGFLPGLGPEWTESLHFWPPTIACFGSSTKAFFACRKKNTSNLEDSWDS